MRAARARRLSLVIQQMTRSVVFFVFCFFALLRRYHSNVWTTFSFCASSPSSFVNLYWEERKSPAKNSGFYIHVSYLEAQTSVKRSICDHCMFNIYPQKLKHFVLLLCGRRKKAGKMNAAHANALGELDNLRYLQYHPQKADLKLCTLS